MRSIALDVHRDFCEVAIKDQSGLRLTGRVKTKPEELELFAKSLAPDDQVALEASEPALAIARILEPHVGRVVRWSSAVALQGEAANHPELLRSRAVVVSVRGVRRAVSASGVGQEGERERIH